MPVTLFIVLGGLLAAAGVGLGALGAHALKSHLTPQQFETFHTAVHYQMIHAAGLILVGLLSLHRRCPALDVAGWAMLAGILLFSGSLYVWVATGSRALMYLVPIGGTAFIVGWVALALGAWRI
jgi:uncharacterized membrane protein YgdD (TMEM256/DUF423 family)